MHNIQNKNEYSICPKIYFFPVFFSSTFELVIMNIDMYINYIYRLDNECMLF